MLFLKCSSLTPNNLYFQTVKKLCFLTSAEF